MKSILAVFLFTGIASSASELKFPLSFAVYSETDDSRLEFDCVSQNPSSSISCRGIQTLVSTSKPGQIPDLTTLPKDQLEKIFRTAKKDCGSLKELLPSSARDSAKDAERRDIAIAEKFCDCANSEKKPAECMDDFFRVTKDLKQNTCRISTNSFEGEFKKNGPNRWTKTSEQGACDFFLVSTLEYRKGKWTYQQTRIGDAKKISGLCAAFEINKPLVYSTDGGSTFSVRCERIEF